MLHHLRFIEWVLHSKTVIVITPIQLPAFKKDAFVYKVIKLIVSSLHLTCLDIMTSRNYKIMKSYFDGGYSVVFLPPVITCRNTVSSVNLTQQLDCRDSGLKTCRSVLRSLDLVCFQMV